MTTFAAGQQQQERQTKQLRLLRDHFSAILFTLDGDSRFTAVEGQDPFPWTQSPADVRGQSVSSVFADDPETARQFLIASQTSGETRWVTSSNGFAWEFCCTPTDDRGSGLIGFATPQATSHEDENLGLRGREMAALHAITSAVNGTLDFGDVLTTLQQQLADQLDLLAGAVYLLDFATFEPELHTVWGVSPVLLDRTTALIATQLMADLPGLTTLSGDLFRGENGSDRWQSAFSVPLLSDDQMVGTLVLFGTEPLTFARHRLTFFETLGHQVGAALQNARVFREARQGREQLRQLTRRLVTAQEAERQRVARELHDELGQVLTCLKLSLDLAERPNFTPDVVANYRVQAQQLTADLIGRVRRMSLELRSAELDELGLAPAARSHIARFSAQTGIAVTFEAVGLDGRRFSNDVETAGYRIVQEALTNVARYANITAANVVMEWDPAGAVRVRITDHGTGFDTRKARNQSSGVAGMRERAVAAGGTLVVESAPGQGTRVEAWLPVPLDDQRVQTPPAAPNAPTRGKAKKSTRMQEKDRIKE